MTRFLHTLTLVLLMTNFSWVPNQISGETEYDETVAQILAESEQSRWVSWIETLSGKEPVQTRFGEGKILTRSSYVMFESRPSPSAFIYLQEVLTSLGFRRDIDFAIHTYDFPYAERHAERNWKNLILTLPGSDPELAQERVLLVAHLDSTSDQEMTLAPGADDNASGAAGLMEAAAVLRNYQFDRTIHLIWFSGEEQSQRGSEFFVEDYADWLPDIVGVINLDMIAFDWDNDRCFEIHAGILPGSHQIGETMAAVIDAYELNLRFDFIDDETAYTLSDHYPFWEQGVPAVMIFENAYYQEGRTCGNADRNYAYHTTADTLTYINQETGYAILQAALAAISHMAAPISPCFADTPRIKGYTDLERVHLKWEPLKEAKAYQLYVYEKASWRFKGETSATQWIYPLLDNQQTSRYKIQALSPDRCQSQPGIYSANPVGYP